MVWLRQRFLDKASTKELTQGSETASTWHLYPFSDRTYFL